MMKEIGNVKALCRYPVKSMAGQSLTSVAVGWHGLDGDRRFAFLRVGTQNGFPWLTASKLPTLIRYIPFTPDSDQESGLPTHVRTPEGQELDLRGPVLQQEIANACGSQVEVMRLDQGVFDEGKVSLISTSTIQAIEQEAGIRLDVARFRPNLLIETPDGKAFEEDEWVGRMIRVGDGAEGAALHVYMQDIRCVMINLDPATAAADSTVLKAVVRMNNNR